MLTVQRLTDIDGLDKLVALSEAFFSEYENHHRDFFKIGSLDKDAVIGYFNSFIDREDRVAFTAMRDGRTVGYVTLYIEMRPAYWAVRKVGHISGLMVDKSQRRSGIGRCLLDRARMYLKERGVEYFTVYTSTANQEALAFYLSSGMKPLYCHLLGRTAEQAC